jgi:hypothetical protein
MQQYKCSSCTNNKSVYWPADTDNYIALIHRKLLKRMQYVVRKIKYMNVLKYFKADQNISMKSVAYSCELDKDKAKSIIEVYCIAFVYCYILYI